MAAPKGVRPKNPHVNIDPGVTVGESDEWRHAVNSGQIVTMPDAPEPEPDPAPDVPESAADRIAAMMEAAGNIERAKVKLYKLTPSKQWGVCTDYTPEEFEAAGDSGIRRRWGPGNFMAILYGTSPATGKFARRGVSTFELLPDTSPEPGGAVAAQNAMQSDVARALEQQTRLIESLVNKPQPAPVDPMAQMMQMMTLMKTMREAVGLDAPAAPRSSVGELAQAIREIKEISKDLGGEPAEPADPLTAALPGVLDMIKAATQQQQPSPMMVAPVSLPADMAGAHQPTPNPSNPGESMPVVNTPNELFSALQEPFTALILLAKLNGSPESGAEIVYEHLPDEMLDMLKSDQWWDSLVAILPAEVKPLVMSKREWFEQVRGVTLNMLAEDAADPHEAGPLEHP